MRPIGSGSHDGEQQRGGHRMWFKVDDNLALHPKAVAAGNAALGLWVRAGSWSGHWLTDGVIPDDVLPTLGTVNQAERLRASGLWLRNGRGWEFHDWEVYQPTREDVEALLGSRQEAGAEGNHARWHVKRGAYSPSCRLCREHR